MCIINAGDNSRVFLSLLPAPRFSQGSTVLRGSAMRTFRDVW
jgi:hypothetical protein